MECPRRCNIRRSKIWAICTRRHKKTRYKWSIISSRNTSRRKTNKCKWKNNMDEPLLREILHTRNWSINRILKRWPKIWSRPSKILYRQLLQYRRQNNTRYNIQKWSNIWIICKWRQSSSIKRNSNKTTIRNNKNNK